MTQRQGAGVHALAREVVAMGSVFRFHNAATRVTRSWTRSAHHKMLALCRIEAILLGTYAVCCRVFGRVQKNGHDEGDEKDGYAEFHVVRIGQKRVPV